MMMLPKSAIGGLTLIKYLRTRGSQTGNPASELVKLRDLIPPGKSNITHSHADAIKTV